MKRIEDSESGQFITFVAVALIILGLLIGLAIDGGRAYLLKSRFSKIGDSVALAGAKCLVGGSAAVISCGCDAARMNGFTNCGGDSDNEVRVQIVDVATPGGGVEQQVRAVVTGSINTSFMRLGILIGCSTCDSVNVAALGQAAGPGQIDLALIMDDTTSMSGSRIDNAKDGALALLDAVLPPGGSSNQVALVPFRGCYGSGANCINESQVKDFTDNRGELTGGINSLNGGGGSGTNICLALEKATEVLNAGARATSKKFLVLLTDGDHHHTSGTNGTANCPLPSNSDGVLNSLDKTAFNKATDLKDPDGSNIEIFVIDYGAGSTSPVDPSVNCDSAVGTGSGRNNDDPGDRVLAFCIASSPVNYFAAPDPEDIEAAFEEIAKRLPIRLTT